MKFASATHRLLVFATLAAAPALLAQASPAASPQSTAAFLQAAQNANGLHGDNLQPWHIKASWKIVGKKGTVEKQGTFEEWWAAKNKFKIAWSSGGLQQTQYRVDTGQPYFTGAQDVPEELARPLADAVRLPLPPPSRNLRLVQLSDNGVALRCVSGKPASSSSAILGIGSLSSAFVACFAGKPPILRMERGLGVQVILNSFVRFQGRYLARDLRLIQSNNREFDIHLGTIESLPPADDNLFTPPQDAQRITQRVTLAQLKGMNVTRIAGQYPEQDHYPGVASGTYSVYVAVLIHADGTVGDVRVAGGPSALRQVALKDVRTWKFRPHRLRHKPAEIEYPMILQFKLYNR